MILYLDTSALVKYYVKEAGTAEISSQIEAAEIIGSATITYVEMASALAKATRMKWINSEEAGFAWKDFTGQWQSITRISVTASLVERAAALAFEYGLRGYDATHFAAARLWQEMLETPVALATYDRELWAAAKQTGMSVWPVVMGE
jgi:predicted nucleic acid-binding protein